MSSVFSPGTRVHYIDFLQKDKLLPFLRKSLILFPKEIKINWNYIIENEAYHHLLYYY